MPPLMHEIRLWLTKADHDRMGAEAALDREPPVTDVAAFHCQQAVEKTLKAYLIHKGERIERTHDLVELMATCARHDPSFQSMSDRVAPLTPYAVRFRYPGPADPPYEEVKVALEIVQEIALFVRMRLPHETWD